MSDAIAVLCTVGASILGIGVAWGDLRARMKRIEKMLGNGHESTYHPRAEARIKHDALEARIARLESSKRSAHPGG